MVGLQFVLTWALALAQVTSAHPLQAGTRDGNGQPVGQKGIVLNDVVGQHEFSQPSEPTASTPSHDHATISSIPVPFQPDSLSPKRHVDHTPRELFRRTDPPKPHTSLMPPLAPNDRNLIITTSSDEDDDKFEFEEGNPTETLALWLAYKAVKGALLWLGNKLRAVNGLPPQGPHERAIINGNCTGPRNL